jgi:hypothetical protein
VNLSIRSTSSTLVWYESVSKVIKRERDRLQCQNADTQLIVQERNLSKKLASPLKDVLKSEIASSKVSLIEIPQVNIRCTIVYNDAFDATTRLLESRNCQRRDRNLCAVCWKYQAQPRNHSQGSDCICRGLHRVLQDRVQCFGRLAPTNPRVPIINFSTSTSGSMVCTAEMQITV